MSKANHIASFTVLLGLLFLSGLWFSGKFWFSSLVLIAGLAYVVVFVRWREATPRITFMSTTFLAAMGCIGALLRVVSSVGTGNGRVLEYVASLMQARGFVVEFLWYSLVFGVVLGAFVGVIFARKKQVDFGSFLRGVYVASANNVAFDFSWYSPYDKVSVSSSEPQVFLAAALVGLAFPVLLHLLCAVGYLAALFRANWSAKA